MHRLLTLFVLFMFAPAAFAHGIGVSAKQIGDSVKVEGYFDDDTPTRDAKVVITNSEGRIVGEGKTDANGVWSFPIPVAGKYRVKLDGGDGHLAVTSLMVREETPATTDGPSRAEFTRTPWERIALGLGLIGGMTGVGWLRTRSRQRGEPERH